MTVSAYYRPSHSLPLPHPTVPFPATLTSHIHLTHMPHTLSCPQDPSKMDMRRADSQMRIEELRKEYDVMLYGRAVSARH